ncbi:MAG: hypothetical protein WCI18_11510 [Pseudomonadota bacterium]
MKLGQRKWWLLGAAVAAPTLYYFSKTPLTPTFTAEAPISLYLNPISEKDFQADPNFLWIHRHCQPANPKDPENEEGGWLQSLEKTDSHKYLIKINPDLKWGTGEALSLNLIRLSLNKRLEAGEELTAAQESELALTSERTHQEVVKFLQETLIDSRESSPIKRPDEMRCFGKFSQIAWKKDKVTLNSSPDFKSAKNASSPESKQTATPKASGEQPSNLNETPVDQIQVVFKSRKTEDQVLDFSSGKIDFVGPVLLGNLNPRSLMEKVRRGSRGDLFAIFAPLDPNGHSKFGEFIAKALNRGEIFGLNYSGSSLLPNFHLIPNNFALENGKPLVASLPEFNFASVADAKSLMEHLKPRFTSLKISHDDSDLAKTFITFFKARLKVTYNVDLMERALNAEKESLGNFPKDDLIFTRISYSDRYLNDLLDLLTKLYPNYKKEFKTFETALDKKDNSSDQTIKVVQDLEKFVLAKYMMIPVGDVSYSYLLSDSLRGETFDRNLEFPLFFKSFRTY